MTPSQQTARRMALVWGVHATVFTGAVSMTEAVNKAMQAALREGLAKSGEEIVVLAGVPFGRPGTTNALRVAEVKGWPAQRA
jgi:pyruvate kinase